MLLTSGIRGEHHITIRLDTLAAILARVAGHHGLTRDDLIQRLFD